MKKILVLLMVLALSVPYFFAEDIEAVAGEGNYKIDMKLHNFVREAYANKIASEICLPFSTYFKMYLDMSFEDSTSMLESSVGTASEGKFNNYLKVFVGSNVTENVAIGIMVGGGTAIPIHRYAQGSAGSIVEQSGEGQLFISLGLKLKSAMFGSKLNDLYIRQNVTIRLAGTGAAEGAGTTVLADNGGFVKSSRIYGDATTTTNNTYTYFGVDYSGTIGTGIPFDIGLPKFALAFEIGYGINYIGYSVAGKDIYTSVPSKIAGNVGLQIKLQINYTPAVENEIWVKPEFTSTRYSYTLKNDTNAYNLDYPGFNLYVGANWKATFAKIVFLKFDCEWKLEAKVQYITTEVTPLGVSTLRNVLANNSTNLVQTVFNKVDPGITLGFNFEGWTLEMKWKPRFAYGQTTANNNNIDSNVWNLAIWDIGVSCSFPPPAK